MNPVTRKDTAKTWRCAEICISKEAASLDITSCLLSSFFVLVPFPSLVCNLLYIRAGQAVSSGSQRRFSTLPWRSSTTITSLSYLGAGHRRLVTWSESKTFNFNISSHALPSHILNVKKERKTWRILSP